MKVEAGLSELIIIIRGVTLGDALSCLLCNVALEKVVRCWK